MKRKRFTPCRPTLYRFLLATLILGQFACSAENDTSLRYDAGSALNPAGPGAPDNDSLAPPDPRDPANWYFNGDLESGDGGWYPQGDNVTITRTSTQSHGGDYSLLVQGRSVAWHAPVMPLIKTLPSGEYEASVWVRLAAGEEAAPLQLAVKTQVDDTPTFTAVRSAEVTADGWTRLAGTFAHVSPGRLADLTLYVESTDPTVSYYVDDLSLVALSNLITNGGVENGIEPWRSQGAGVMITQASEQHYSGSNSLLVTGRAENWNGPVMDLPPLSSGRSYQASVWVRLTPGTSTTRLNFTLKRTVDGTSEYIPVGNADVTNAAWVQLTGAFTHTANGSLEELFLYIESSVEGASASFYVDDLELGVAQNFMVNGDLESGLSGWGPFGSNVVLSRTDTDAHTGDYSLHVSNREADWQGASFSVAPLTAGNQYLFSCWVRMAPANPDATLAMTVKLVDGTGENYLPVNSTPVTTASWVELSGAYFHDPDGVVTEMTPYIQASVPTAEYLIDACTVTPQ